MATNPPEDIGTLLQRMSLQDQALYRLTPEQSRENVSSAGPLLLKRIKEGFTGFLKGNSTDIINTIQQVSDLITPGMAPVNEGKPLGDELFKAVSGIEPTGSGAEEVGSLVSVGGILKGLLTGASKAMIVPAIKAGRPQLYEKAVEMVRKDPKISNKELFDKTGAYLDKDKVLKAFISDRDSVLKKIPGADPASIKDILEHPRLFESQPELASLRVRGRELLPVRQGAFYPNPYDKVPTIEVGTRAAGTLTKGAAGEDIHSVILHEGQHAVQDANKFTPGGNTRMFQTIDPVSVQEKLNRARASGDPSQVDAANRFAKKANELVELDLRRAHAMYENLPGEQEARFTQYTKDMGDVEGNTFLKRVLDSGKTPQTWDTQFVPQSSADIAPRAAKK